MTRADNGAAAVMDVLRQAGCDEIKITQVIDRESGVIGWYGIEERTGRVFDLIAYPYRRRARSRQNGLLGLFLRHIRTGSRRAP